MKKLLVTYSTMAGSTADVAVVVAEELTSCGFSVDVFPVSQVKDLSPYTGIVVGGPMIMGWHRESLRFLRRHRRQFEHLPLAVFITAVSLTKTETPASLNIPVYLDEKLPKPPANPTSLSFREKYARLSNYLRPVQKAVHPFKPASIGVFGGRLEYGRLKWWAVLFAMVIIQAPAGDRRNWDAVREWSAGLPSAFKLSR